MKMSKFSTLLRILAFVLSLMLLCGTLPVSALDDDLVPTAETTAGETQEPTEEPSEAPSEEPAEVTETPSESDTGSTEPASPTEEPQDASISIKVYDNDEAKVTYATSSLGEIKIEIPKGDTESEDKSKISVVFVETDAFDGDTLDEKNLIPGFDFDSKPAWITLGTSDISRSVTLNLQHKDAPALTDGEYRVAVRDGHGNVSYQDVLLLENDPSITLSSVSPEWSKGPVTVYAYVSDYVDSVSYTNGGTHSAEKVNATTFKATFSAYAAAGKYTFTATDKAGNTGSETLNQELKIDTDKPTLSIEKYTDGKKDVAPGTFLSKSQTVYAVIKAEDKKDDTPQSGIDAESILIDGKAAEVTEDGDTFRVKLSDPTKVSKLTVKDNAKNISEEAATETFFIDETAPVQSDMQVVFSPAATLAEQFLQTLTFGLYTNDALKMTVKVSKAGESDIAAITVKDNGSVLEGTDLSGDVYGVFSREYTLPIKNEKYDLTVQAVDEAGNESEEIKLSDIKTIFIEENALEEGKTLFDVVATNQAPNLASFAVKDGKAAVNDYYTTADGKQKVSMTVEDPLAGLENVDVYFGKSDEFVKTGDEYTTLPAKLTGESRSPIYGTGNFTAKHIEETIEFSLPANLESGNYTVLAVAKNYSDNTAYLRSDFKVDNTGPTLSGGTKDPAGWTNGEIKVTFTAKDNFSDVGIKPTDVKVKKPGGGNITPFPNNDGTYYFKTKVNGAYTVTAKDKLGNPAEELTIEVSNYDETPPVVEITGYDPEAYSKWTSSEVKVSFTAVDNSGASLSLSIDDGTVISDEGEGNYSFIAKENRAYTITAVDEAGNPTDKETATILYDNQKPEIEKVVFSTAKGNFKQFGIYDKEIITATVYVRSPGNAPVDSIVLKDGSDPIATDAKVLQDGTDKNLYSRVFPLGVKDAPYDLSIETKNASKLEAAKNIEDLALFFADDTTGNLVQEKYKTAFELVVTESKPAVTFVDDIENYTSVPCEADETKKVFAGGDSGIVKATVTDDLSGVMEIESVIFDGTDVTNSPSTNFTIDPEKKETSVDVSYEFGEKLASGKHTFEIVAKNNAGNSITENNSITFYVDQTPPTGTYSAPKEWTNQPITVTLNINDNADDLGFYSGVDEVKVDDGAVAISGGEGGVYTFSAESRKDYTVTMTDKLGNPDTLTVSADDIWFDNTKPEIVPDGEGNEFTYENTEWVSEQEGIVISFKLTDDLSGVDTSSIVITGDKNEEVYSTADHEYTFDKNAETGDVTCSFRADKYQTYTVTVTDSVKEDDENKATFSTDKNNMPKIDTEAPVVKSVTFESAATAAEKILNVLSFGIYSNNDIKMTVKATDEAPSSGIAAITAEYNDSVVMEPQNFTQDGPNADNEVTATCEFIIQSDSKAYDPAKIMLQAEDVAEYKSEKVSAAGSAKYVVYPESDSAVNAPVEDGFEIVASNEKPVIGTIELDGAGKKDIGGNVWFKGEKDGTEVQVTAKITAALTKLHEIKVYLNDTDITDSVNNAGQITDFTEHTGDEVTERTISFSTGALDCVKRASSGDAKNVVRIVAVGNNSEDNEDSKTFYIDDTTPEVTSVRFTSAATAADSVLNVLTFGLYSNDKIKMTVNTVDDIAGMPSSGIKTISLSNSGSGTIDKADFTATNDSTTGSVTANREYTFTISDKKYDPAKIELSVTDNVGNDAAAVTVAKLNSDGKIYNKESDTAKIFDEDKFEIVSTSKKATVSDIELTSTPAVYSDGSKSWYQGDEIDEVGMSFSVSDTLSKIHSVKTDINGNNIINKIYTNFENESANTADGKDHWTDSESYSANTADSSVTGYLHRISESSAANRFTVEAVNNSGITTNKESDPFYIDDVAPYITEFAFEGDGYSDVYSDEENGGLNPAGVELTEYGFYFKSTTEVTVTASDFVNASNMQGSGVKYIGFRFVDINGETYDYGEREVDGNNQATFTVDADFKGQIFAYAVDNVTNKGSEITPAGLIVESGGAHEANSGASIEFGQANYRGKDNNDIDLFSGDVTVTFTISDTISGLRDAYYTVTNGSQVVDFQKVNVSNSGTLDNSSWSIAQREAGTNLVTRMTLTDTISASSFNANNLVVTIIARDRAGYTIETKKSCSIDITKPTIEIKYDPNDPVNTDSGNSYFSTTRTATITVTERNFNPADFDWSKMIAIEGTVPGYAAGANWSTSYSDYTDSSQHIATVTFADDGKYEVILNFTDMAGNKADQVDGGQFYIDKTVPTINVSLNPDKEYVSGTVVATVTIVEHNFNPDGKYLTLTPHYYEPDQTTPKSGPTLSGWSTSGDTHTATLTFSQDGKYAFDIAFKDMALNSAQPYSSKTFYVDQTKPVITFGESAQDGHAYDIQVQPSFDVFDFNYAGAQSVTYSLTRHFYDFTSGKQTSSVVDDSTVRADYIQGVIKQLFTYPLFAKTEDNDGVYVLTVSATDRAGNVSDPSSITFSVNCFGSVFLLASDETIQLAERGYTSDAPDVMIKEINVNQLKEQTMTLSYNNSNKKLDPKKDYSITSSGGGDHWYEYLYKITSDLFEDEGSYTVTASSVDAKLGTITTNRTVNTVDGDNAAHKNCPVSFVVDKTPPTVTISGVEENGAYSEAEREIQITCLDDNLDKNSFVLKINGETIAVDPEDIDDSLVGQLDIKYTILASGQQTDYMVEAEAKDYAGVTGSNAVNKFTLSATWLTMFFHNTVAVVITSVVLAGLIALGIFLAIKKRRKNAE